MHVSGAFKLILQNLFPGGHVGGWIGHWKYMETKWGIEGRRGRIEIDVEYQGPPPCTLLLKAVLCVFVWTRRPTAAASNRGDFLLCDFRRKYCN